ncbi:unnamed protein product [Victoria cruziana]
MPALLIEVRNIIIDAKSRVSGAGGNLAERKERSRENLPRAWGIFFLRTRYTRDSLIYLFIYIGEGLTTTPFSSSV